jgi:hypothetical protein
MSRPFKIEQLLTDDEIGEFLRLNYRRHTTIDAAHAWMKLRGHSIGRTSVANFISRVRPSLRRRLRRSAANSNIAALRMELADIAPKLNAGNLAAVVGYAKYLATAATSPGEKNLPAALPARAKHASKRGCSTPV